MVYVPPIDWGYHDWALGRRRHYASLAPGRSERWMLDNLSDIQRKQYERHGVFQVNGRKHRYFLRPDTYNCDVVDERGISYCISVQGSENSKDVIYDGYDNALCLMLWIRYKERTFRRRTVPFGRTVSAAPVIFPR